jgi:hypothetical protein
MLPLPKSVSSCSIDYLPSLAEYWECCHAVVGQPLAKRSSLAFTYSA